MTTLTRTGTAWGCSVNPKTDAMGSTSYHWRAWVGAGSEGNVEDSQLEAQYAVEKALERMRSRA